MFVGSVWHGRWAGMLSSSSFHAMPQQHFGSEIALSRMVWNGRAAVDVDVAVVIVIVIVIAVVIFVVAMQTTKQRKESKFTINITTIQCKAIQYNAIRCNTMRCNALVTHFWIGLELCLDDIDGCRDSMRKGGTGSSCHKVAIVDGFEGTEGGRRGVGGLHQHHAAR